jgi:hypothetical protein
VHSEVPLSSIASQGTTATVGSLSVSSPCRLLPSAIIRGGEECDGSEGLESSSLIQMSWFASLHLTDYH